MYRPLPNELTIKNSNIEGLGLFATVKIKKNSFIGLTHIRDEMFEGKYIRTPLGGFYNHSKNSNIMKMVSDVIPKFNFGDVIDPNKTIEPLQDGKNNRENLESKILKSTSVLPLLPNDTNNVIEFNSGFDNSNGQNFKRSFWELFK